MSNKAVSPHDNEDFLGGFLKEWQSFSLSLTQSADLASFLTDPANSLDAKKQLVRSVFGEQFRPFTIQAISLLLERGKLAAVSEIESFLSQLIHEWQDMLRVQITTPYPLDQSQEEELRRALKAKYGKEVLLEKEIDPSLIGGAVLKVGDKLYDDSIKTHLAALTKELLK